MIKNTGKFRMIRGRWLNFVDDPSEYIALPFGTGLNPEKHEVQCSIGASGLIVKARPIGSSERFKTLLPVYSADVKHKFNNGETYDLVVSVADMDYQYLEFQRIIGVAHYLSAPKSGMFIGCRFKDSKQEHEFLKSRLGNHHSRQVGAMIGCAVIQNMVHGKPNGRAMIAEKAFGPDWKKQSRTFLVERLGIAWGSRFALDDPYTGLGIGTILAEHMAIIAKNHRLPSAKYIEVIRTVTKARALEIVQGAEDWLTKAGYKVYEIASHTPSLWERDPITGNRIPPRTLEGRRVYRKLYYLKKCLN